MPSPNGMYHKYFFVVALVGDMVNMSDQFKNVLKRIIIERCGPQRRGRPRKIDIDEAIELVLDLVQSGIQWRRVKSNSVSYAP